MGNGPFARPSLAALAKHGTPIGAVVARPDRAQGKHLRVEPGPVAALATSLELPLHQPEDVNAASFVAELRSWAADLLVVADFGQILSAECLQAARLGGINIHGSLLPRYRGAAPIAWAIYHGEKETGVSVLRMTPKMDAGGVMLRGVVPIGPDQTAGDVEAILSDLGARLAVESVNLLANCASVVEPQDPKLVTKAPKLKKDDGRIRWDRKAQQVHDQVRAMLPWPGGFFERRRGDGAPIRIKVLKTSVVESSGTGAPGAVLRSDQGLLHVQTGAGVVSLVQVHPAGKSPMDAATYLRGNPIPVGEVLT
jgi:methionyl-tRNA formyltransferase